MTIEFNLDKSVSDALRDYFHLGDKDEFKQCRKCKHRDKAAQDDPCVHCRWCYPDMSEEQEHD